jgi:hypothetical protein
LFYVSENISSSYLSMMGSPKATFKLQISETTSPYFILRQRNKPTISDLWLKKPNKIQSSRPHVVKPRSTQFTEKPAL